MLDYFLSIRFFIVKYEKKKDFPIPNNFLISYMII